MQDAASFTALIGRLLIALIFVVAGFHKIFDYAGLVTYMEAHGVAGVLLPAVIVLQLVGSALLILGYWSRAVALILAGFTIITALIFHTDFADQIQIALFLKNLAMAGGMLMLVAFGPGRFAMNQK